MTNSIPIASCPGLRRWEEILDASDVEVGQEELLGFTTHLEGCADCQAIVEELAGGESWSRRVSTQLAEDDRKNLSRLSSSICALWNTDEAPSPVHEVEESQLRDWLEPPTHPELLGRIGRYELEKVVGRGGAGLVFRGFDTTLHRIVAVKLLAPHLISLPSARERFIREGRAAASLNHPNIVPVHDVVTTGKAPALVMPFVPGPTLEDLISEKGALPWPQALSITLQIAGGLHAAHQVGMVHRDVKPGNVLLEADGARAMLSDFGLVRTLDEAALTRTGTVAGTPDYMSPEQVKGKELSACSDLFSLGSVLYTMLTGKPPFSAPSTLAVAHRVSMTLHRPVSESGSGIPMAVSHLVDRLLVKKPERRLQSAEILRAEIQALLSSPHQLSKRYSWLAAKNHWSRVAGRTSSMWAVGAGAVAIVFLAIGLIAGGALQQGDSTTDQPIEVIARSPFAAVVSAGTPQLSPDDLQREARWSSTFQQLRASLDALESERTEWGSRAQKLPIQPIGDLDSRIDQIRGELLQLEHRYAR